MTKVQTVNILAGQMNLDKDPRLIDPQKEYTYANNFRNNNSADGSEGSGGNIIGNLHIASSVINGGTSTVIGTVAYQKRNATIYFVYNSMGNHSIRILENKTITVLLENSFLNFSPEYPIEAVITNDDLVWTDGRNEPRIINLERLINYNWYISYLKSLDEPSTVYSSVIKDKGEDNSPFVGKSIEVSVGHAWYTYYDGVNPSPSPTDLGALKDTYREITNDTLNFIAQPPDSYIEADYKTVNTIIVNNLFQNQYKFTYRYVYLDDRKSVWSTHSLLPQPLYNELNGVIVDQNANNAIYFTFRLTRRDIKRVEFGAIKNNGVNVMIIDTLDLYDKDGNINNANDKFSQILFDGSAIGYAYFQDDTTYPTEAATDFNRLYDYVPPLAKGLELINNRVIFNNITEGFDLPVPDATIQIVEVDANIDAETYSKTYSVSVLDSDYNPFPWTLNSNVVKECVFSDEFRGATLEFHTKVTIDGTVVLDKDYSILHNANESIKDFIWRAFRDIVDTEIIKEAKDAGFTGYSGFPLNKYATENEIRSSAFANYTFVTPVFGKSTIWFVSDGYIYKTNSWSIPYGYIPYQVEFSHAGTGDFLYEKTTITQGVTSLKSNSKYILGVKYKDDNYRESGVVKIGYADIPELGNSSAWGTNNEIYQKRYLKATINHLPAENATNYCFVISRDNKISKYSQVYVDTVTSVSPNYEIDISNKILEIIDENDNCILADWDYAKGDRCRCIGIYIPAVVSPTPADAYVDYELKFDLEIVKYDAGVITIPPPTGFVPVANMIIELYRPKKVAEEGDQTYFEISRDYPIINGYHTGNIKDQSDINSAVVELDFGDTYLIFRRFTATPDSIYVVSESENISDFFTSNAKAYGRVGFIVENMRRKHYYNLLRFGGNKNDGTDTNRIARFTYEDYDFLPEQYGEIAGAVFSGDSVSVYQANKKTSYYIEQSLIKQANGTDLYTVSDKVLNNKRLSVYNYGTVNPESIVKVNGYVYFFDATNGCFVRDADNGMFSISDYGINKFSKLLGAAVLNEAVKVYGAYDEYNKEVVWAWNWENDYGYGISFVETGNQWKSFEDFYLLADDGKKFVSLLGTNVNKIVSYINGEVYLHDSSVLYNTLYGRTVTTEVEVVGNSELLQNKIFDYVTVESDHEWFAAERDNSGNIIATESFVDVDNGLMKSIIPSMRKKEENYVSEFGRDTLTKMVVPTLPSGITSEMYKYLNGRRLRGKFVKVKLRNNSTDKVKIFSVIINASISERL